MRLQGKRIFNFRTRQRGHIGEQGGKKSSEDANEIKLAETVQELPKNDHIIIFFTKTRGSWLTARGTTVTVTVLSAMEFRGFLCAHHNINPPNIHKEV